MKTSAYLRYKLQRLQGLEIEKELTGYRNIVKSINKLEDSLITKTDLELQEISSGYRQQIRSGMVEDGLMQPVFALVREVSRRKLNMRPFDCQLIAGIVMHQGKLAQMDTGEGKTLAAVLPVCLNAYGGKGVHILTFNDYLAKRDANWMKPVYDFLGFNTGYISQSMSTEQKKEAYACDITYTTAKQAGFDFLYAYLTHDEEEITQPPFHYAIVDEADAILIDEARNPLVVAGNLVESSVEFYRIAEFVCKLKEGRDFSTDEYQRDIVLNEPGIAKAEKQFSIPNLFEDQFYEWLSAINLSLQANFLLKRDVDYIIRDGKIKLVDEFTGRVVEDRKWQNGLQTAVEAKEKLIIQSEGTVLGSIPLQHFIDCYPKLAGMTATAETSAEEFNSFYKLPVVVIPPNKNSRREDQPEIIFTGRQEKNAAILSEVKRLREAGRPVLVGTLNVKESEALAEEFSSNHIPCAVLNARNDEAEAAIIADAGRSSSVTISTNMAGRGTDILLGGKDGTGEKEVLNAGGLHVLGTNRHESRRIDNQLRGRSGRQGDPGSSRFFISLEDELMVKYRLKDILPEKYRLQSNHGTINNMVVRERIYQVQRIIEGQMYDLRRSLFDYTRFIEEQRKYFMARRQKLLFENIYLAPVSEENEEVREARIETKELKDYILFQFDQTWSAQLNYSSELREGIHLVRLGGENPLRVFQKKTFENFHKLENDMHEKVLNIINNNPSGRELKIKRPSSTWTYMVNDNPFGNRLGIMLMNNANIGMQTDPFSLGLLLLAGFFKRVFPHNKKRSEDYS